MNGVKVKDDLSALDWAVPSGHWVDSLTDFHEQVDPSFGLDQASRIFGRYNPELGTALQSASDAFCFVNLPCDLIRLAKLTYALCKTLLTQKFFSEETKEALLDVKMKLCDVGVNVIYCLRFVAVAVSTAVINLAIVLDIIPRIRTMAKNILFLGHFEENKADSEDVKKIKNVVWKKHVFELFKNVTRLALGVLLIAGVAMSVFGLLMWTFAYYGWYRGSYICERKVQEFIAKRGIL